MAEATDNELPWDDQTDTFITNIDKSISKQYSMSLRDLLLNPDKYVETKDVLTTIDKIKANVDDYFNGMRDSLADEQGAFSKALEDADTLYTRMEEAIATKASLSRVPYIRPYDIDFNPDNREEITINQFNNATDGLVTKLINVSNYVGNISTTYGKYTIGSWIFSGQRDYIVSIYLPDSIITQIDGLNTQIDGLIDAAYQQIKLSLGK